MRVGSWRLSNALSGSAAEWPRFASAQRELGLMMRGRGGGGGGREIEDGTGICLKGEALKMKRHFSGGVVYGETGGEVGFLVHVFHHWS